MKKMMLVFSLLAFLPGCSLIGLRDNLTIDQKANLVRGAARTSMYFALKEIYKDDQEKMLGKALMIRNHLEVSVPNNEVSLQVVKDALLANVSSEYRLLLQNAIDVLNMYFVVDESKVLTEDNKTLILFFVLGLKDGAEIVINELE